MDPKETNVSSSEKTPEQIVNDFNAILENDPYFKIECPNHLFDYGISIQYLDDDQRENSIFTTKSTYSYLNKNKRTLSSNYISHLYTDSYSTDSQVTIIDFLHAEKYLPTDEDLAVAITDKHIFKPGRDNLYGQPVPIISPLSSVPGGEEEIRKILKSTEKYLKLVLAYETLPNEKRAQIKDPDKRIYIIRNHWDDLNGVLIEIKRILEGKKQIVFPDFSLVENSLIRFEHPPFRMSKRY